jgi:hypothetical protein
MSTCSTRLVEVQLSWHRRMADLRLRNSFPSTKRIQILEVRCTLSRKRGTSVIDTMKSLFERGMEINVHDANNQTPFYRAAVSCCEGRSRKSFFLHWICASFNSHVAIQHMENSQICQRYHTSRLLQACALCAPTHLPIGAGHSQGAVLYSRSGFGFFLQRWDRAHLSLHMHKSSPCAGFRGKG